MIAVELGQAQIDKTGEVSAILENSRAVFQRWLSTNKHVGNLDIPNEALSYLLLPPRLLELVANPRRLYSVVEEQRTNSLAADIYYASVDLSEKKLLEIYLLAYANNVGNNILHVAKYGDSKPWRGLGIATSFYQRLREAARAMGFWIITGNNDACNIGFFRDKLGRTPFSLINPEFGGLFFPSIEDAIQPAMSPLTTIDFLYPEDKQKYC